jgi:hypothetical protein
MRWILCFLPLVISACHAQDAQSTSVADPQAVERAAIEKVVKAYNDTEHKLAPDRQPWSEVTAPKLSVTSVRFLSPDVASVDAVSTQFGTTIGAVRAPVLLIMLKEKGAWRIADIRLLGPPASAIPR